MPKPWLVQYPAGVPAEIDTHEFASLKDVLASCCARFADLPAYNSMGTVVTYRQLDEASRAFATWLQKGARLQRGDRIALMMPNLLQYPVALFGVLRAGMVVVNVNPLYTPRELEHQLNDAGELLAHCRQHLTAYKVPRIVEFRSEPLPKSNIGEILRRELRDGHAAATAQAASPPVASA